MTPADHVIMVVSSIASDAENLRSQIEFMDSANVITAMPDEWRARLGESRLEALWKMVRLTPLAITSRCLRDIESGDWRTIFHMCCKLLAVGAKRVWIGFLLQRKRFFADRLDQAAESVEGAIRQTIVVRRGVPRCFSVASH